MAVMPFGNQLATFELSGAELRSVLICNAQAAIDRSRGLLQVAGLTYVWRSVDRKAQLISVTVGGKPLDPKSRYTIATNDYVALSQPIKYLGLTPKSVRNHPLTDIEAVVAEFRERDGVVDARLDGRIKREPEPAGDDR
jgi:2',3'-cyclic-nucleotide 2'-phosphodiesterase (5'-nucleotidase family)